MLPFVPLHKLMRRTADDGWQEKHLYAASSSFTAADSESALPFLEHPQQPPPSFHPFRHLLRIVGYILAAIALVVIVLFIGIHPSRRLSPIPIFPTEILIFHQDAAYAAPASPSSDALWDANLPNGKGFVLLKDASEYRLPPGLPSGGDNETDLYGVTWTHEYHCLVSPAFLLSFVIRAALTPSLWCAEIDTHRILESSGRYEQVIRRGTGAAAIGKDGLAATSSRPSKSRDGGAI